MPSNFLKDDPLFGTIDLDDQYITDSWLIDKYVGGNLFAWGLGSQGGLGDGTTVNKSSPVQIGSLTNWSYVSASLGAPNATLNFSMAIKTDGTLWAWGGNNVGQLGRGIIANYSSPIQIGALTNWKQVSAGSGHCLAVKTDGTLWAWGWNSRGQLGNNNRVYYSSPVQIGALNNWKQVSAGFGAGNVPSSAAVNNNGELYTWGDNTAGTLGIGVTIPAAYSNPIQVGTLRNWKKVSMGIDTPSGTSEGGWIAAIKTDGTLWTWGGNRYGQLGLNDTTPRSSPVQVGTSTNWKEASAVGSFCLAIKTDGTLWGWGTNLTGQLGLGYAGGYYSSPIQIGALSNWKEVTTQLGTGAAAGTSFAVKTDGTLWGWGLNSSGQLGIGNTTYYSSPIQIGGLTNWKYVSFGGNHVLGLTFTELN